mgnify:FL=1
MKNLIINSKGEEDVTAIVSTLCNIDFVKGNTIYRGSPMKLVMVQSDDDLAVLESYEPGAIAFTRGFESMWQKGIDGEWATISQT